MRVKIQNYKRSAVRVYKRLKKVAIISFAKLRKFALITNKKIINIYIPRALKITKLSAKKVHHHIAKRPHEHLKNRWHWYDAWHAWEHHKNIHRAILAGYILLIGFVVVNSYSRTYAVSDLLDNWNFTNSSNYTLDSGIEVNGSTVQLKPQNYSSDANTMALFHADETNGTVFTDSSAFANNSSNTNVNFVAGSLNNSADFNGTTSTSEVADSAGLSFSGQNTIEAWTKLRNNISAGSTAQRQGIVDKGDYQLYYDNETGKVTYELADQSANTWSMKAGNDVAGSWDLNGKRSVNAYVKMGNDIYAGIGVDTGDAEVWKWDGTVWSLIGGGPNSANSSWPNQVFEGVYALATDGANIYAGLGTGTGDAEVWKWNGTAWAKIGGDSLGSSWAIATFEQVWSLAYFGGNLYAGIGNTATDAEVWRYNGTTWAKIGGDGVNASWNTTFEIVSSLASDGTNLYAGVGNSATDAEVWKWNGTAWAKIGGDGLNTSWNTSYETVRSLVYSGGQLYAGIGDGTTDAEVWSFNGTTWTKIGGDGLNASWNANYEIVNSLATDGTNIYAGLGNGDGDGEVWEWNGTTWTKIGGDGLSGSWTTAQGDTVNALLADGTTLYAGTYDAAGSGLSYSFNGTAWTQIGGNYVKKSWGYYGLSNVQVTQNANGYMYAGTGNTAGAANVWRFDGINWLMVGGQGINGSWAANTYEQVLSMASYNNNLYVGIGNTAGDAEVWRWDGAVWAQVGGDSLNSSWPAGFEEVYSMASYGGLLYAGLGNSANEAEVWSYNGTNWTKIGGDSINSGWTTNYDRVSSMTVYSGKLTIGLGVTATEAEVWQWSGTVWTKIGGDGLSGGWNTTYEQVESMVVYNGKLYAGVGNSTDDAELWEYNGTVWTKIGGDEVNSSWAAANYEVVKTMAVYNGDLFVGLGNSTGDGVVWRLREGIWSKSAGAGANDSWGITIEQVESLSAYKGKLYAAVGNTANTDAQVWEYGNNGFVQSNIASFDTSWHHVAASYDGSTMRIYIDGVLDNSATASVTIPDSTNSLLLGGSYGGSERSRASGIFDGQLDEIRISNIARSGFTSKPYSTSKQVVTVNNSVRKSGLWHWDSFAADEVTNGGSINYRLSNDDGSSWRFWDGTNWVLSNSIDEANSAVVINSNILTFPTSFKGMKWQAILSSDGNQKVMLNSISTGATSDLIAPIANASSPSALKANGGSVLPNNGWTNGASPYFNWAIGADSESGILGYCAYLGSDNTADPETTKGLFGTSPIDSANKCQYVVSANSIDTAVAGTLSSQLSTSNTPYYLLLKAIDKAGNVTTNKAQFQFRFDNTPPTNPAFISAPSGFVNSKAVTLTWPTSGADSPRDDQSGLAGMQYKINSTNWYGDSHSGTGDINDLLANDGAYSTADPIDYNNLQDGINTVYFRTWDQAGNVTTSYASAAIKLNTSGAPTEPQNIVATPNTNTTNSFAFSWDLPGSYVGDTNNISYCYTINSLPTPTNCSFTPNGVRSLGAGPYATQPGANTLYVVAKDESGNINYSSYGSKTFSANTASPGIPLNMDIVDVSIKSTSSWRLALTWDTPVVVGAGIANYKVYRSEDGTNYSPVGASSSTTYIDSGLTQKTYYYKVRACDSTNNCGADGSVVNMIPTGKFTNSALLISEPKTSNITTKKAHISWVTDRTSDSKIAIGTKSGSYSPSEVAISLQTSNHEIDLDNLSAGTTYYYIAKWTDEDGNTGVSQEYSFITSPAPSLKEVSTLKTSLSNAVIQFTSREAYKAAIYYGKTEAFGGVKTINTSASSSTYTTELDGLDDGSKYFYKIVTFDNEGNSYEGNIFSFSTPSRPKIADLRFQPVEGEPTSTQKVTWTTNVPTSSELTYGINGSYGIDMLVSELSIDHELIIKGLQDDSQYFLVAQSRDAGGNLAISDRQVFKTALDTRPPKISDITTESSIRGTGAEARGQIVVSWKTDEPATSQVAFAEGSNATVFNNKTSEDTALSTQHIVIVSDLPTSKVYSVKPISNDHANNSAQGEAQSAIIGRASDSVLTIVFNTLKKVFGY